MALFNFGKKKEKKPAPSCCSKSPEGIHSVKILGGGCKSCHDLLSATQEAVKAQHIPIEVEYISDMEQIMAYGVMRMPALVVNDKVVSTGRVLKAAEVETLLRKF